MPSKHPFSLSSGPVLRHLIESSITTTEINMILYYLPVSSGVIFQRLSVETHTKLTKNYPADPVIILENTVVPDELTSDVAI